MNIQLTAPTRARATIGMPSSKSITNRALLIAALSGDQCQVLHPALCDDSTAMVEALSAGSGDINVGAAGTAMRFLTAYFATRQGVTVTLDGNERMRQRPIGPLVDALRALGGRLEYAGNEGFPPLRRPAPTLRATPRRQARPCPSGRGGARPSGPEPTRNRTPKSACLPVAWDKYTTIMPGGAGASTVSPRPARKVRRWPPSRP